MKRTCLNVKINSRDYRLFVDDVKKIYKVRRAHVPPIPKYVQSDSEENDSLSSTNLHLTVQ